MLLGLNEFIARFDKRIPTYMSIDRGFTSVLFSFDFLIFLLKFLIFSADLLVLSLKIVLTVKLHSML